MTLRKIGPLGWLGIALVVAIALMVLFGVASVAADGGYYHMMGSSSWGWAIAMMAVPLVLLLIILTEVLRGLGNRSDASTLRGLTETAVPLEIIDERYARGEITRDEYLRIRADLQRSP